MDKLKPCPFCGEVPKLKVENTIMDTGYRIDCTNVWCVVCPSTYGYHTEQEAIEAWNTRKGEENG